jgi:hypothetical protein
MIQSKRERHTKLIKVKIVSQFVYSKSGGVKIALTLYSKAYLNVVKHILLTSNQGLNHHCKSVH